MNTATASIRDLRINFRSVKRKIQDHGQVIITDNGVPSYEIRALLPQPKKSSTMPNYYARILRRQPKPMSEEETKRFHEENRGDC